jgi:hypothetical protein
VSQATRKQERERTASSAAGTHRHAKRSRDEAVTACLFCGCRPCAQRSRAEQSTAEQRGCPTRPPRETIQRAHTPQSLSCASPLLPPRAPLCPPPPFFLLWPCACNRTEAQRSATAAAAAGDGTQNRQQTRGGEQGGGTRGMGAQNSRQAGRPDIVLSTGGIDGRRVRTSGSGA